jgi:hypothetical protein
MPENAVLYELPSCDCDVCMVPHDDEIHAATLSLREWFRYEVTKYFFDDEVAIEEEVEVEESTDEWYLVA